MPQYTPMADRRQPCKLLAEIAGAHPGSAHPGSDKPKRFIVGIGSDLSGIGSFGIGPGHGDLPAHQGKGCPDGPFFRLKMWFLTMERPF